MDCLIDYIGLRTQGAATPESGMYINDLPGITVAQLTDIANAEQATFLEVWNTVQRRSSKIFETAFTNAMSKKYRLKKISESFQLSSTVDTTVTTPMQSGTLRGILIDCYYIKSPFHYIPLNKVHLYIGSPVPSSPIPLYVYEVHDNNLTLLDTFSVTAVAGWNDITINKKYADSAMLYIAYDATEVDSVQLLLDSQDLDGRFWASYDWFWSHLYIQGASYAGGQFTEGYDTFGLTATIGLQCSFDVLVCNYKNELATAWWYLLGAELMQERIYTDRINRYTTVDLSRAKDLRAQLKQDFMNELLTFVDSIHLTGDWCIECDAQVKRVEAIP
jgi:hypothetical protein